MARFFRERFPFRKQTMLKREGELLSRIAELVDEGYTFHEATFILLPHHTEHLIEARKISMEIFREGKGPTKVLEALGIESHRLLPIELAEEHGRLSSAIRVVAQQLLRVEEVKERTKKLLSYPIVLFVFMGILFFLFRTLFLPNMQKLGESRSGDTDGAFAKLPELLLKLPDLFVLLLTVSIVITIVIVKMIEKKNAEEQLKIFIGIPGIRYWYRMLLTASFAREVGNMLQSGMSMQDALDVLRKQERESLIQVIAERTREKIVGGDSFSTAVKTDTFVPDFSSFVEHGEYGGHLGKELIIFSQLLESRMEKEGLRALRIIQPLLFTILAICILSAYLAILLPMYELLNTI